MTQKDKNQVYDTETIIGLLGISTRDSYVLRKKFQGTKSLSDWKIFLINNEINYSNEQFEKIKKQS